MDAIDTKWPLVLYFPALKMDSWLQQFISNPVTGDAQ
jgi:hypothetical protein